MSQEEHDPDRGASSWRKSRRDRSDPTLDFHGALFRITAGGNVERIFRDEEMDRLAPSDELTRYIEKNATAAEEG
jgi:hypothetical protein